MGEQFKLDLQPPKSEKSLEKPKDENADIDGMNDVQELRNLLKHLEQNILSNTHSSTEEKAELEARKDKVESRLKRLGH